MQTLLDKAKSLGLRVDLAVGTPQDLETGDYLVQTKLELLKLDSESKLTPRVRLMMGGISDDYEVAKQNSLDGVESLLDNPELLAIFNNGNGYEVAISQPFIQKDEQNFVVVGKVEMFDFGSDGKARTLKKISFNVLKDSPILAQDEALQLILESITKLQ